MVEKSYTISNQHIAANANTVVSATSYNKELNLLAYAAGPTILICSPRYVDKEDISSFKVHFTF
jgi:hypothetical protein